MIKLLRSVKEKVYLLFGCDKKEEKLQKNTFSMPLRLTVLCGMFSGKNVPVKNVKTPQLYKIVRNTLHGQVSQFKWITHMLNST